MKNLGRFHSAKVLGDVSGGVMLALDNGVEVLLPRRLCPATLSDKLDVFLYLDAQGTPVVTTQRPKAEVGQFAYLKAIDNSEFGTFLDWGLDKDLLVPFAEQHRPMVSGKHYLVYLYVNKVDGRIVASSKIDKFLSDERPHTFRAGQAVGLIIANSTELGFKAIVDHSHWGVLYKNEVLERLSFGQTLTGFIKYVRPDGRLDLSLQGGKAARDKNADVVLQYLRDNNNYAPINDKSDPVVIQRLLGISKAAFKKGVGALYKRRVIALEDRGIRLVESEEDPKVVS
ncbi:S1-like domain-containing RNA-binding protein [Flavobacteriaceae bacterium]|nr:S1-like domain-containing RNA-binding protein [Flavobacteriaceae bacterium]